MIFHENRLLAGAGFTQAWKVLEYTGLSWKVLENEICLEKYLKNTQRPWKVLEFYHLQEFVDLNQYKNAAPNKGTTILY